MIREYVATEVTTPAAGQKLFCSELVQRKMFRLLRLLIVLLLTCVHFGATQDDGE